MRKIIKNNRPSETKVGGSHEVGSSLSIVRNAKSPRIHATKFLTGNKFFKSTAKIGRKCELKSRVIDDILKNGKT